MKHIDEELLLRDIYNLILDVRVTEEEREILLEAKKHLEEKVYYYKVVKDLNFIFGNLARCKKLSEPTGEFFLKLYKNLGRGLKVGIYF